MTYFHALLLLFLSCPLFASLDPADMIEKPEGPFLEIRNSSYPVKQDFWTFSQVEEMKVSRLRVGEEEFFIPWLLPAAVVDGLAERVRSVDPDLYEAVAKNIREGGHVLLHYNIPGGWQLRGDDIFSERPSEERVRYDHFMLQVPDFISARYIDRSPEYKTLQTFFSLLELKEWLEAYCKDFKILNPNTPTSANPYPYLCFRRTIGEETWDIAEVPSISTSSFADGSTTVSFPFVLDRAQAEAMNGIQVRPDHIYYVQGDQVQVELLLDAPYSQIPDDTMLPLPIQLSHEGLRKGTLSDFIASQRERRTQMQSQLAEELVEQMASHQIQVRDTIESAIAKSAELEEDIASVEGKLVPLIVGLNDIRDQEEEQFQADLAQLEALVNGRNLLSKVKSSVKGFWETYIKAYSMLGLLAEESMQVDEPQVVAREDAVALFPILKAQAELIHARFTREEARSLYDALVLINEEIGKSRLIRKELDAGIAPLRFKKGTSTKERIVMLRRMDTHLASLKNRYLDVFTELEELILSLQEQYPRLFA